MISVARTPAALLRQMADRGRPLADLELVAEANELACELFGARFEIDGAAFMTHLVGTASAMVQLDAPAPAVAASVCHSIFERGDWGDGRRRGPNRSREAWVRSRLGDETTEYVLAFGAIAHGSPAEMLARTDQMEDLERWQILIHLCDLLEKWEDGGVLYAEGHRDDVAYMAANGADLVALARRLGGGEFGDALAEAYATASPAPPSLRLGRNTSVVLRPRSMTTRPSVRLRAAGYRVLRRARGRFRATAGRG